MIKQKYVCKTLRKANRPRSGFTIKLALSKSFQNPLCNLELYVAAS